MKSLKRFYYYIAKLLVGYTLITLLAIASKQETSLVDIVTACKICSLFILIMVNGDIAKEIDRNQKDIKLINHSTLAIAIFITIISAIKFFNLNLDNSSISSWFKNILTFSHRNMYWISAFPLVAYAFLDLYIAYIRKGTHEEKAIAIKFLVFVDLACVLPLVIVYLLTGIYGFFRVPEDHGSELFTSGSMAIALLASAIAAKAVDVFFDKEEVTKT